MSNAITFSPDLDKFNNSGRFGSVVQIVSVLLKRIEAVNNIFDYPQKDRVNCNVRLRHKTIGYRIVDPNFLSVDIEGRLEIAPGGENKEGEKHLLATIIAVYELKYILPKEPMPKEYENWIGDFADINGVYNAWPYFRARMQDLASDMGIAFTLPTFRIIPKKSSQPIEESKLTKPKMVKRIRK